jgi:hypothetical protein
MSFKKAFDNIERKLKKVTTSKKLLNQIGEFLVEDVKATTRKGRVVDDEKFKGNSKLKPSTKKWRKKYETVNSTGEAYSTNKSNLTFTGELINSIVYKISGGKLTVFARGTHSQYTGLKGGKIGKRVKNSDIIKFQSENERTIMSLTKNRAARIRGFIREALRLL